MRHHRCDSRRGAALVLLLVSLITLLTFVALAIDLGLLAVARTQCQDAADAAAMTGARTLNGSSANNNNFSAATPNAVQVATANTVLSRPIQTSKVAINVGRYVYVNGNQRFEGQFPGPSAENWSMVRATVGADVSANMAFSRVFGFTGTNIQATATAAHRPRDVMIVLDYSGSMRFGSLVRDDPFASNATSNNPDTVVPLFGHYSNTGSAAMTATSFTSPYDPCNLTSMTSDGRAAIVQDFYQDTSGTAAFSPASAGYATAPGGDNYLLLNQNAGPGYSNHVQHVLGLGSATNSTRDPTWETSGYTAYGMTPQFNGYTQGPGYWGKTFFMWPPDPRPNYDWRQLYFVYPGTSTPIDDNARLWDSSGNWRAPGNSTYQINYAAILNFIKNVGPNPFPSQLRSGRILYYDQIPNNISSSYPPSDLNERFWKDYIDYCLGLVQTGSSSWMVINDGSNGRGGYGTDYTWGTVRITAKSSLTGNPPPYMHYADNPRRPRTHFWFGGLSMVDFMGNYNLWYQISPNCSRFCWWPGTCHESPMYACKLGIRAALTDVENNHPNDLVALSMFAVPRSSANDSGGRFNRVRVGLSRNYTRMQESLWYPPETIGNASATVRPYDSDNMDVPRAVGGTCYSMGLMQAYNQFSANTSLTTYNPAEPAGDAGGNGRKGAQKIIIFETDGAPNTTADASFQNLGQYNSYYSIRYNSSNPSSSEFPFSISGYSDNASTVTNQINNVCNRICALDTASPPGYSTTAKPVLIHCIGFGPVFAPGSSGRTAAINTLNQMQIIGKVTDGMPSYKIIYGPESTVVSSLQHAFTQIMQSGVQVSLIE
ncbi:MAG: pilus assembly protein TadG-related protein [Pirellulales bacterium]